MVSRWLINRAVRGYHLQAGSIFFGPTVPAGLLSPCSAIVSDGQGFSPEAFHFQGSSWTSPATLTPQGETTHTLIK